MLKHGVGYWGRSLHHFGENEQEILPEDKLWPSVLKLKTYTNKPMKATGTLNGNSQYEDKFKKLALVVTAGNGPSLLGQKWLNHIKLNWKNSFAVCTARLGSLHTLMHWHKWLFAEGFGTVKPYKVSLQVQQGAKLRSFKTRPVPFAIRDAVGKELDRLEHQGILKKVTNNDWAAPIVAVPKKDDRFRICCDYKVPINYVLSAEQYLLPKPD